MLHRTRKSLVVTITIIGLCLGLTACGAEEEPDKPIPANVDAGADEGAASEGESPDAGDVDAGDEVDPSSPCELHVLSKEEECPANCDDAFHGFVTYCTTFCGTDQSLCPDGLVCKINFCYPPCTEDDECTSLHPAFTCTSHVEVCR